MLITRHTYCQHMNVCCVFRFVHFAGIPNKKDLYNMTGNNNYMKYPGWKVMRCVTDPFHKAPGLPFYGDSSIFRLSVPLDGNFSSRRSVECIYTRNSLQHFSLLNVRYYVDIPWYFVTFFAAARATSIGSSHMLRVINITHVVPVPPPVIPLPPHGLNASIHDVRS